MFILYANFHYWCISEMTTWNICHKSGRVLFTTNDERTAMNRAKYGWRVENVDDRYEIAKQHGMSIEFIDWFWEKKKASLGSVWFITMGAMWEGWKGSREQLIVELPKHAGICINSPATPIDGYQAGVRDVCNVLTNAGLTVKLL